MTLAGAEKMAKELMQFHGVHQYQFEWMQKRYRFRRAGQCNWQAKIISLQPRFVECNYPFVVKRTLLHEIAHALVGSENGHNKVWKKTAISIGDDGGTRYGKEVKKRLPRKSKSA